METTVKPRVAVITGASSGIGKEAAKMLASQGWKVIGLGRNPQRCAQAKAEIMAQAVDGSGVAMIRADLGLMADCARAAVEIAQLTDRVDILLNNAGGLTRALTITPEGNENTFASNHLGHYLLTNRLLPLLRVSACASPRGATRVINVSSSAHEFCKGLDWDDVQMMANFETNQAYCRVKLANILFTRELAKRLQGGDIVVHAMHPGLVDSNFGSYGDDAMQSYLRANIDKAIAPAEAAANLVWLATADDPGNTSGDYYYAQASIPTSAAAADDAAAERLWQESEKLVELALMGRAVTM